MTEEKITRVVLYLLQTDRHGRGRAHIAKAESLAAVLAGDYETLCGAQLNNPWRWGVAETLGKACLCQHCDAGGSLLPGDETLTIQQAAGLLGVSNQAVAARLDRGTLTTYLNLAAPRRQGRRLVSRKEVEGLIG